MEHDGNALADMLAGYPVELDAHPVPHPGCERCAVLIASLEVGEEVGAG